MALQAVLYLRRQHRASFLPPPSTLHPPQPSNPPPITAAGYSLVMPAALTPPVESAGESSVGYHLTDFKFGEIDDE